MAEVQAQSWTSRSYTSADGLPGNTLYNLVQDRRGAIWTSSEGGVASFDGVNFRAYRVGEGLPDNEVTALRTDAADRLWAYPYREPAVVYNPLSDRFEKPGGGITPPVMQQQAHIGNAVYSCDTSGIYKSAYNQNGRMTQRLYRPVRLNAAHLSRTGRGLSLINDNGTAAWLVDTANLSFTAPLPLAGALASDVLDDGEGHLWITTLGQGLLRLSRLPVVSYANVLPPDMSPSAVAIDGPVLLCGDNRGRIAIVRQGCVERLINISKWSQAVSRIRAILVLRDGYYIAVEGDASLLLDKQYEIVSLYNRPLLNYTDRCAALLNDSIILAGSHTAAQKLLYKICEARDAVPIRSTAIGADRRGRLLIGSTDGLHRRDDSGLAFLGKKLEVLRGRVSAICTTPDGLTWIGFADNYLVALDGDNPVGTLRFGKELRGSVCNALCAGAPGELWAGTDAALNRIRYNYSNGWMQWKGLAFGEGDGVPGSIAGIAWQHDTVYAATSRGIFAMPGAYEPPVHDVPVFITGMRINEHDTAFQPEWTLPYGMNDLDISFAGIELSGMPVVFQYAVNGEDWQEVSGGHLVLNRLQPGAYRIRIRALRRDGSPSPGIAELKVSLRAPFWRLPLFWIAAGMLLFAATVLALQRFFRRKRERQLRRVAAEHELVTSQQQTFAALMNPHFIFNALNSIQHYVLAQDKRAANRYLSGFGRLIRMNFESAQKSFISLEEELERLQLYLSLEQMRFGEKLRYTIAVAEDVAPEDWQIPAMIIQPYVENALLHGIAPAEGIGLVEIKVSRAGDVLQVLVLDNGVGMNARPQLRKDDAHRSRSMELIARRITVLRKLKRGEISISVAPVFPQNTAQPGTVVTLLFAAKE